MSEKVSSRQAIFTMEYLRVVTGNFSEHFLPYISWLNHTNHSDLDTIGNIFSSYRTWVELMPILVKGDDVRSVTKAKAHHGQLQVAEQNENTWDWHWTLCVNVIFAWKSSSLTNCPQASIWIESGLLYLSPLFMQSSTLPRIQKVTLSNLSDKFLTVFYTYTYTACNIACGVHLPEFLYYIHCLMF